MAKVIIISRQFPKHHERAGEDTHFVEKIWNALGYPQRIRMRGLEEEFYSWQNKIKSDQQKIHTIRAGSRWKAGDKMSLRVWEGRPYHSDQIKIYDDIEVLQVFRVEIMTVMQEDDTPGTYAKVFNAHNDLNMINGKIPQNDGLSIDDFLSWFTHDPKYNHLFTGQIICWKDPGYRKEIK